MENVRLLTNQNPFATTQQPTILAPQLGGSDDWYGACSIETFLPGVGNLFATHEDAHGFLDYPTRFRPANFWYKDAAVQSWMYGETYDNYLDTFGADAVTAFYHSGHGGMDANGVFFMPMGSAWGSESWANSNQMALGNEEARYIFLSTCFSLRVLEGHSPIRTWWNRCLGFRMLFGFETVSVDNPNYGKFFWEEWNRNKSLSQSWLDASWRISHGQAPSVVAVGANQAEATDRLYNERFLNRQTVTRNWFQWRWYNAQRAAGTALAMNRIPEKLSKLEFAPMIGRTDGAQEMAYQLGFTRDSFNNVGIDPAGNLIVESEGRRAFIGSDGRREFLLKSVNTENRKSITPERAIDIAQKAINDLNLNSRQQLSVDTYRIGYTCGGTQEGSGKMDKEYATDITVLFRPNIEGVSNVNHDHGNFSVTVDNDGSITTIRDTTRPVENIREAKLYNGPRTTKPNTDVEKMLKTAAKGRYGKNRITLLSDTVRVGYDYSGKSGNLVAQGTFEADFGQNIRKQFIIRVPIPVA